MIVSANHQHLKAFITTWLPGNVAVSDQFISCFKEAPAAKEECITGSGKVCSQLVFVVKGLLRLYLSHPNGNELTTGFFPENSLVTSYFSFNEQAVSDYSIQALEPCELLVIGRADLLGSSGGSTGLHLLSHFAYLEHQRKEKHSIMLYTKDAAERFLWFRNTYPLLQGRITDHHVSSLLALSRETVVRKRKLLSGANCDPGHSLRK